MTDTVASVGTTVRPKGPLFVSGGIPLQRADGEPYETRRRLTLCRCGGIVDEAAVRRFPWHDRIHRSLTRRTSMNETALVLLVEAAEPVVGTLRLQHDPMAPRGVPAHVTVLYPFRPVLDAETAAIVADLATAVPPFEISFATIGRFPGQVVYLAPEPAALVGDVLRRFFDAFPDCPPYGGTIPDVIPHLTVGDGVDDATADRIAAAAGAGLPVTELMDRITLLVEDDDGHWTVDRSWPLGGPGTRQGR